MAMAGPTQAEWYAAGQIGANFADRLTNIEGPGSLAGLRAPDFDLKNAVVYGVIPVRRSNRMLESEAPF